MTIRTVLLILLLALLNSGCANTGSSKLSGQLENIMIPEPLPINFRSQLAIARYNRFLSQSGLSNEERAELLYMRGIHYDKVGLAGLAQYDFGMAKQLKPDMAEAYNSIGIHYTQQEDFIEAYESFDSALDINPELDFALLNRGIALYYGERNDLAVQDLQRFYDKDTTNVFAAIWLFLAQSKTDKPQALLALREHRNSLEESNWADVIVDFYLGDISRDQLLNSFMVGVKNTQELNQRMCEVYFYLGKFYEQQGDTGFALNYFKLVLSTNIYDYVEHRYSRLEISMLRKQLQKDS